MPKKPSKKTDATKKASPPQNETPQESSQQKRRKGPKIRLTSHKTRSKWFQARSSWPVREAPVNTLVRERRKAQKRLAAAKTAEEVGMCRSLQHRRPGYEHRVSSETPGAALAGRSRRRRVA